MNSLHQYEAWLDELDKSLYLTGGAVAVELGPGLAVPLVECRSVEGIVEWGVALNSVIRGHSFHLPVKYLLGRFVRLACEAHRLNLDQALLVSQIEQVIKERHTIEVPK